MTRIFADAGYWIALLNRNDQLHSAALAAKSQLRNAHIVTTDEVLCEVLNFFGGKGCCMRDVAAQIVEGLREESHATVVEQSRATFDGGLRRYKFCSDKEWSIVDCISFELMARDGITEALAHDHHFVQAGFKALLRDPTS